MICNLFALEPLMPFSVSILLSEIKACICPMVCFCVYNRNRDRIWRAITNFVWQLSRNERSSPSTKELHGWGVVERHFAMAYLGNKKTRYCVFYLVTNHEQFCFLFTSTSQLLLKSNSILLFYCRPKGKKEFWKPRS